MDSPLRKVVSRDLGCILGTETLECGHTNRLIPLIRNGVVRWYGRKGRVVSYVAKSRRCEACGEGRKAP